MSTLAIISTLLAAGVAVGGAATGRTGAVQGGKALMLGSQSMLQRHFLAYVRTQESAADQAAAKYLERTHQSGKGMLGLFRKPLGAIHGLPAVTRTPYVMSPSDAP